MQHHNQIKVNTKKIRKREIEMLEEVVGLSMWEVQILSLRKAKTTKTKTV